METVLLESSGWFVGIDWASARHAVTLFDHNGEDCQNFEIKHSREGLDGLVRRLGALDRDRGPVMVGIERPDGRLVDRLLAEGYQVVAVSTNAIKAWREAEVISGAKSDAGDAAVIAWYLRIHHSRLKPISPFSETLVGLRKLVTVRSDLVAQRVGTRNQLAACLEGFWPGVIGLFSDLDSDITLAFLEDYPSPEKAKLLGVKRMGLFCARHSYRGRTSPTELVARLARAPEPVEAGVYADACQTAVAGYVAVLRTLNSRIKTLEAAIDATLGEHPDGKIFTSLPRSGRINAAQMLAEWGDSRQAYADADAVAVLAGMCPVTKASGKHHGVEFRWACNKRFRNAIAIFADNSRHESEWARHIYEQARARGASHPHAIRILGRAWIRVIYRCWINNTPYDAERHGNARKLKDKQQPIAA